MTWLPCVHRDDSTDRELRSCRSRKIRAPRGVRASHCAVCPYRSESGAADKPAPEKQPRWPCVHRGEAVGQVKGVGASCRCPLLAVHRCGAPGGPETCSPDGLADDRAVRYCGDCPLRAAE